jgi:hypothetical protein
LPILPKEIAQTLKLRHCQIPQDETAHNGETTNVIHGSFFAPDSSDWAVLCKENADSHILVFRQADAGSASKLASLSVLDSLEGIGYDHIGYVRRIRALDRKKFATYYARGKARKVVLMHDAISDAMSDRFETVYYWQNGKWAIVHFSASE